MIENQSILSGQSWSVMKWKISPSSLDEIRKWLNNTSFDVSVNRDLAGHIKYEKSLGRFSQTIDCFQQIIRSATKRYLKEFILPETEVDNIVYVSPWVNRQRKYEYNPRHIHDSDLSYVLWVQIPFYQQEEEKVFELRQGDIISTNGKFSFFVHDIFRGSYHEEFLLSDKSQEGTLLMFPSKLPHSVHPFYTSDEDRITIAGNIWVNPKGEE